MKPSFVAPLVVAAAVAAVAILGHGAGGNASSGGSWLVISSTRAGGEYTLGEGQAYSMRRDGSRMTSLLGQESGLTPIGVSADGRAVVYSATDGSTAVYVSRADGTRLTRVVGPSREPDVRDTELSPDGGKVAVTLADRDDHPHLQVVDGDGSHRHHLGRAGSPDWSSDGRLLVFATGRGCGLAAAPFAAVQARVRGLCGYPKLSPDAQRIVFQTKGGCAVVRTPGLVGALERIALGGGNDGRVLLSGTCEGPEWSPDGRWIAYQSPGCPYCDTEQGRAAALKHLGIWVVRPDGSGRRRVGPADEEAGASYSWSPDSTRIAIATGAKIVVADLRGHVVRLGDIASPPDSYSAPTWSSDGQRLALAAQTGEDPAQLWSIRADGTELRRLTNAGVNDIVGVAQLAPARRPVPPLPRSEWVLGPRVLATARPVARLSADGAGIAYAASATETDCEHVAVWTPGTASIRRVWWRLPAPCYDDSYAGESSFYELAYAGSVVGWSTLLGCGNSGCGVETHTATLPKADPRLVDENDGADYGNEYLYPFHPVGRGAVFVVESHVRVALGGGKVRRCTLPGDADSVDGHSIAVHVKDAIAMLDDRCAVVNSISVGSGRLDAVLLDRDRVVVARAGLLEVYDVASRALVVERPLPTGYGVEGAAGGVVVLRRGRTVLALRLDDGRSASFRPCRGPVHAAIDGLGLYYSYATVERQGRLVLIPARELERRLASGTSDEPSCLRSADAYRTGKTPAAVAVRDLNGDGRKDLVTADEESGTIGVFLRGGAAFDARLDYPAGVQAYSLAVGDLDGDGPPDVAVAPRFGKAVAVLLNGGDGTFAAPRLLRHTAETSALALGDLNRDGRPDLVLANSEAGSLSVLLNRGGGRFAAAPNVPTGEGPSALAIADLTGDGTPDLVVAHGNGDKRLVVLEGKGDGSFGRPRSYELGADTTDVALSDLNGDRLPDVVAASDCEVVALFGRGHGAFGAEREVGRGVDCAQRLAVGDLDRDGRPDIVASGREYAFPSTLSVFLNRGRGRFAAARNYESGPRGVTDGGVAIGDLDGDRRNDVVRTNYEAGSVAVLANTLGVCRVQGFRGRTFAAARTALAGAHCRVGRVTRAPSKQIPSGRVVAAEPRFGAYWPGGAKVDLVVSSGP